MIVKLRMFILCLAITIISNSSARKLDEQTTDSILPVGAPADSPVADPGPVPVPTTHTTVTFYMHDILGGSNPSARAITGIVDNPAVNGQLPFAKPNGAILPVNTGVKLNDGGSAFVNNNNIPFLTGLSGMTSNVYHNNNGNNNNNNFFSGAQLPVGSTMEKLMFGTITVIDDQLTEGPELGSGLVGRAQGFYVASSVDGSSQVMAFTAMFQSGNYDDSLCFFGVHLVGVSESQLAIMGGTGKFANAKGFAVMKTLPPSKNQHETDGIETIVEFIVHVTY